MAAAPGKAAGWLGGFDTVMRALRAGALVIAGLGMLYIATICTVDVVAYVALNRPFPGVSESTEVVMAVTIAMTLAHAQAMREHISVDILTTRMGPRMLKFSEILSLLVACAVLTLLAWRGWSLALDSLGTLETSSTLRAFPIYPWKFAFATALTLAAVESVRQILHVVCRVPDAEPTTAGTLSADVRI